MLNGFVVILVHRLNEIVCPLPCGTSGWHVGARHLRRDTARAAGFRSLLGLRSRRFVQPPPASGCPLAPPLERASGGGDPHAVEALLAQYRPAIVTGAPAVVGSMA